MNFDFEFDFPYPHIKRHATDVEASFNRCLEVVYLRSPHRGYYLFYPPDLIAAAILALSDEYRPEQFECSRRDVLMLKRDF